MADLFAGPGLRGLFVLAALALLIASAALAQAQPAPVQPRASGSAAEPAPQLSAGLYSPGEVFRDLVNPVVADIDGTTITLSDVGDAIRTMPRITRDLPFDQLYPRMLEYLIQRRALVIKARREHLDADPVVKRHMQEAGDKVLEDELLNRMLDKAASEDALLSRYHMEYDGKPGPEEVHLFVILTRTEEQARQVIKELAGGADFATLAKRDSIDATRQSGGDLGFRRQGELAPEVGGAAFVMEPGQVSPNPIHSSAGWFVIKAAERRRVAPPSFPEVRAQLRHEILEEDVAKVAREIAATAEVHEFNINGTPLGGGAAVQGNTRQ